MKRKMAVLVIAMAAAVTACSHSAGWTYAPETKGSQCGTVTSWTSDGWTRYSTGIGRYCYTEVQK